MDLELISKIQRQLKQLYINISDSMMAGNIDNMEKYKYMLGQAHAYQYISQEISNPVSYTHLTLPTIYSV